MNPVLAPRSTRCMVCVTVAELAHIAVYIWEEDGTRIPAGTWRAAEYLASIGVDGNKRALEGRIQTHVRHIEAFMDRPSQAIAPMQLIPGGKNEVAAPERPRFTLPERTGPAHWTSVQQNGMDVGNDALALIENRLRNGTMEDKDLIAVAKLGQSAAAKRADIEAKGKRLNQVDELLRMAAGMTPPPRLVKAEAKRIGPPEDAQP